MLKVEFSTCKYTTFLTLWQVPGYKNIIVTAHIPFYPRSFHVIH